MKRKCCSSWIIFSRREPVCVSSVGQVKLSSEVCTLAASLFHLEFVFVGFSGVGNSSYSDISSVSTDLKYFAR